MLQHEKVSNSTPVQVVMLWHALLRSLRRLLYAGVYQKSSNPVAELGEKVATIGSGPN